jgi:hypothetical protein
MRVLVSRTKRLVRALPTAARKARLQAAILVLGSLTILPLQAQWAVVDADAIAEITKVESTATSTFNQLQQTYNLAQSMAIRAQGMWRFQGPTNLWKDFQYNDQYGTLSNWSGALNSGNLGATQNAFAQATDLPNINQGLSGLNPSQASSLRAGYSAQEIMDGNTTAAMTSIGQIHASAAQYQNAIAELMNDDESDDPDLQSQLAVEERTSNAMVLGLQAQQDTNQLLSDLLQQQIAQNLVTRGAVVSNSNASLDLVNALQTTSDLTNGYAQSLQNWSITGSQ